eukprot:tig00001029_g6434.t1
MAARPLNTPTLGAPPPPLLDDPPAPPSLESMAIPSMDVSSPEGVPASYANMYGHTMETPSPSAMDLNQVRVNVSNAPGTLGATRPGLPGIPGAPAPGTLGATRPGLPGIPGAPAPGTLGATRPGLPGIPGAPAPGAAGAGRSGLQPLSTTGPEAPDGAGGPPVPGRAQLQSASGRKFSVSGRKASNLWMGKRRASQLASDYYTNELHRLAVEQASPKSCWTPGVIICCIIVFLCVAAAVVVPSVILTRPGSSPTPSPSPSPTPSPIPIVETLVFEDSFEGSALDRSKWNVEVSAAGGGNWEFQVYLNKEASTPPGNFYVSGSKLRMRPTLTENLPHNITHAPLNLTENAPGCNNKYGGCCTDTSRASLVDFAGCERDPAKPTDSPTGIVNPVASARINTRNKPGGHIKYGRVEVKARMPRGRWLWPAIWMLPVNETYGEWPLSGEIDIAEGWGNPRTSGDDDMPGVHMVTSTLHWGIGYPSMYTMTQWTQIRQASPSPADFATQEIIYGLYWDEKELRTYYKLSENDVQNPISEFKFPENGFFKFAGSRWPIGSKDPWGGKSNAPFDQPFYLIINLAVGGTMGYWSKFESIGQAAWSGVPPGKEMKKFYEAKDTWSGGANGQGWWPEWQAQGSNNEFVIDWVKMWERRPQTSK